MRKTLIAGATALAAAGLAAAGAGTATAAPATPAELRALDLSTVDVQVNTAAATPCGSYYDVCLGATWRGELRGIAGWRYYGDHMLARDVNKDGYWIKVDWHTDYGRDGKLADKSSKGDGNQENYNMREDGRIRFQIEIWDEGHQVTATKWSKYYAI